MLGSVGWHSGQLLDLVIWQLFPTLGSLAELHLADVWVLCPVYDRLFRYSIFKYISTILFFFNPHLEK